MKFIQTLEINSKKLKYRKGKAALLVVPIAVLVALSIVISSQSNNLQTALDENVFNELEQENTIVQMEFQREEFGGMGGFDPNMQTSFTDNDLEVIKSLENVEAATMNYQIPLTTAVSSDLFDDKVISLNNLVSLDPGMVGIYTDQDFTYEDGEPVPIILNSEAFQESYEDWGGSDTFTLDFRAMRQEGGDPSQASPIKSRSLDYSKEDLLGKEITITFGGLPVVRTYDASMDTGIVTYTKLTESDIETKQDAMISSISRYWDTDLLSEGVSYTFKVVGIVENLNDTSIYIPDGFGEILVDKLSEVEQSARNEVSFDEGQLGSEFIGLYYNGLELSTQLGGASFGAGGAFKLAIGAGIPGRHDETGSEVEDSEVTTYQIPGLILETDSEGTEVLGRYTTPGVLSESTKTGQTISIKIDDILNRTSVIEAINDAGYALQDINDLGVLESVQRNLEKVSAWVIVSFIALTVSVIALTMTKFVSESTKEIGIFRAVGFTKKNILAIFMTQAVLYTAVGYMFGVALGVIGNIIGAQFASNWFANFVDTTVAQSVNVVADIDTSIFTRIDFSSMAVLSAILLAVVLIIAYFPALRASNISPVEAIKSE